MISVILSFQITENKHLVLVFVVSSSRPGKCQDNYTITYSKASQSSGAV